MTAAVVVATEPAIAEVVPEAVAVVTEGEAEPVTAAVVVAAEPGLRKWSRKPSPW